MAEEVRLDRGSSYPFSAEGQGVSWSLGAPFARWFNSEEEDEDDMEGASMGGVPSKVVKFTGSNRVMTVSELRNLVYQKTLAGGSKRSQSAHTMTQVEKFGVLRECCDGEARVPLHDHFQARIDRNREQYEAVEAENLQLETQTRAAWQRAYDVYTAELAAREAGPGAGAGAGGASSSACTSPRGGGGWRTSTATRPSWRSRPSGPAPAAATGPPCGTQEAAT
jgi:hypothetical protein